VNVDVQPKKKRLGLNVDVHPKKKTKVLHQPKAKDVSVSDLKGIKVPADKSSCIDETSYSDISSVLCTEDQHPVDNASKKKTSICIDNDLGDIETTTPPVVEKEAQINPPLGVMVPKITLEEDKKDTSITPNETEVSPTHFTTEKLHQPEVEVKNTSGIANEDENKKVHEDIAGATSDSPEKKTFIEIPDHEEIPYLFVQMKKNSYEKTFSVPPYPINERAFIVLMNKYSSIFFCKVIPENFTFIEKEAKETVATAVMTNAIDCLKGDRKITRENFVHHHIIDMYIIVTKRYVIQ
jgi:hypothetical protein